MLMTNGIGIGRIKTNRIRGSRIKARRAASARPKDRFSRRTPYGAWVEALKEGSPSFYLAHSLSPHGLRLLAVNDYAPPVGEPVQLRLLVENETRVVAVQGEVVNYEPAGAHAKPAFAIRFTDLDEDHRLFLTDLYDEACGF